MLRKIPDERRSYLHRDGNLKLRSKNTITRNLPRHSSLTLTTIQFPSTYSHPFNFCLVYSLSYLISVLRYVLSRILSKRLVSEIYYFNALLYVKHAITRANFFELIKIKLQLAYPHTYHDTTDHLDLAVC
jgi:hypothetical protein